MMEILHYLVQAFSFFIVLIVLNAVWENVKSYGAERKYGYCLLYLAGAVLVLAALVALTDTTSRFVQN